MIFDAGGADGVTPCCCNCLRASSNPADSCVIAVLSARCPACCAFTVALSASSRSTIYAQPNRNSTTPAAHSSDSRR
jgi:hypothetical protein